MGYETKDEHVLICSNGIWRVQACIDQAVVAVLEFRDVLIEDLLDPICQVHIFDFDTAAPGRKVRLHTLSQIYIINVLEWLVVSHARVVLYHPLVWFEEPFLEPLYIHFRTKSFSQSAKSQGSKNAPHIVCPTFST